MVTLTAAPAAGQSKHITTAKAQRRNPRIALKAAYIFFSRYALRNDLDDRKLLFLIVSYRERGGVNQIAPYSQLDRASNS
jgi:hypothetical protein